MGVISRGKSLKKEETANKKSTKPLKRPFGTNFFEIQGVKMNARCELSTTYNLIKSVFSRKPIKLTLHKYFRLFLILEIFHL